MNGIFLVIVTLVMLGLIGFGVYRLVAFGREDRKHIAVYALEIASVVVGSIGMLLVGVHVLFPPPQSLAVLQPDSPERAQRLADFAAARAGLTPH